MARSRQDLVTKYMKENMRSRITTKSRSVIAMTVTANVANNKRMPEISQQAVFVSPTPLNVLRLESLNRQWLGDSRFVNRPTKSNKEVRHEIVQVE